VSVSGKNARVAGEKVAGSDGFEWFARAGFVARGLLYGIIGILAIKLALGGGGGDSASQKGALEAIAHQPFGKFLLILVAVGLAGYSLWRLIRAALGHGPEASDSGMERVAAAGSGIVYAGFCALAIEILVGAGSGSSTKPNAGAAGVFAWPGGVWLVGIVGAFFIVIGLYQGYRGVSHDFLKDSKTEEMSNGVRAWVKWIGTFGYLSRMVVFVLVGVFLIKAAIDYDPNKAVGLDGALAKVRDSAYGPYTLGVVATGLIAFGLYSLSDARYRRL